jgi:hypothetical protein
MEVRVMPTREIQRNEWVSFFDSFSSRHRGWLATVEIMDPEIGDQTEARDLPLEGITVELNERGPDQIEIIVGNQTDRHVSNTVVDPKQVWLKSSDDGADEVLEIKRENETVLIRFRSAMLPELVDGL